MSLIVFFFLKTGDLGISAVTGIIVGAFLGAAMLIIFYFFRQVYVLLSKMVVGKSGLCGLSCINREFICELP